MPTLRRFLIMLVLVVLLAACSNSDKDTKKESQTSPSRTGQGLQLLSAEPLANFIGDSRPNAAIISPDGTMLAWLSGRDLCIYTFDDATQNCSEVEGTRAVHLYWAPDSRYIIMHEDFYRFRDESDLWFYDVGNQTVKNITDDGVNRIAIDSDESFTADTLPIWNPINGDLYFERFVSDTQIPGIYRISADDLNKDKPEAELVTTINSIDESNLMIRSMAISPDGKTLALVVFVAGPEQVGVYVVDLDDGTLKELVSHETLVKTGMPPWYIESDIWRGDFLIWVNWTADGQKIIVGTENPFYNIDSFFNHYAVDATSGEVTPLLDWSDAVEDKSVLVAKRTENGHPAFYDRILEGVWLRDFDVLVYRNFVPGELGFSALTPASQNPIRLVDLDPETAQISSRGEAESVGIMADKVRVVTSGYLLTFDIIEEAEITTTFEVVTEYQAVVDNTTNADLQFVGITAPDPTVASPPRRTSLFGAMQERSIYWFNASSDEICAYHLDDSAVNCSAWGVDFVGRAGFVRWSPDGQAIVYSQLMPSEADVYLQIFDPSASFNLTSDDVAGDGWQTESVENLAMDTLALWHPTDGHLYFFRTLVNDDSATLGLYRIEPAENAEPTLVADLSAGVGDKRFVFDVTGAELNGSAHFSPTGDRLAFSACDTVIEGDDMSCSVFNLDMASSEVSTIAVNIKTDGMAWGSDGTTLFVMKDNATDSTDELYVFDRAEDDLTIAIDSGLTAGAVYGNKFYGLLAGDDLTDMLVEVDAQGTSTVLLDVNPDDLGSNRFFVQTQDGVIVDEQGVNFMFNGLLYSFTEAE